MDSSGDLRLGALLVELGVVQKAWIQRGLTFSKYTGLPIGKSLVLLDCITSEELRAAVEAQSMLRDRLIDVDSSKEAMEVVKRKGWPFADALVIMGVDAHVVRGTRLGELLAQSGAIDAAQIDIALNAGESSGLPLGRILLLLNKLSPSAVETALQIQREIRAGTLDRDKAIELLQIEDFKKTNQNAFESKRFIKFGELFLIASMLDEAEIESAVSDAASRGKMVGQVLVERKKISDQLLVAALRLQDMVWKGTVTAAKAADALAGINQLGLDIRDGFARIGLEYNCIEKNLTLCDFLRISGYMSGPVLEHIVKGTIANPELTNTVRMAARGHGIAPDDLNATFKVGLRNSKVLVNVLKETRSEDGELVKSAVLLHELVRTGKMKVDQALLNFSLIKLISETKTA
jgi:hypothetical protein